MMMKFSFGKVDTLCPNYGRQLEILGKLAPKRVNILLTGETGTGKELLARAIHAASGRPGPFIAINCAALPDNLVESELFGHTKGAFSGADKDRPGALLASCGGTLFLDEIGDAPLSVQVALLRALELGLVKAVGSETERPVDLRVVAATSQDLNVLIESQLFRLDLYYRVAGHELLLPPLRDRKCDLPILGAEFAIACEHPWGLSRIATENLRAHDWPGNARELRSSIARAAALTEKGEAITVIEPPRSPTSRPPPPLIQETKITNPIVVPQEFRSPAQGWLSTGRLAKPETLSRRAARTRERLILICLLQERKLTGLTPEIQRRAKRLLSYGWDDAENGRSLKSLAAVLERESEDVRKLVRDLMCGDPAI